MTPITDKQAGWALTGRGANETKELIPDPNGPFVHACVARKLEHAVRELTADRDSWREQASDRANDAVRALAKVEKAERENAVMKEAIRALAARDFGSQGWDAICESAALRLRSFLSA